MRYFTPLTSLVIALAFLSCTKDDPGADDGRQKAKQLVETVRGKWLFASGSLTIDASSARPQANRLKSMVSPGGRLGAQLPMGVTTYAAAANTGFIEFLDDNTYVLYDGTGGMTTGNFEATSDSTITLSDFGSISDIKFNQEKINFKLTYSATNSTFTIVANKAAQIPLDDRTALLCRTWLLSTQEDGAGVYNEPFRTYDEKGDLISQFVVDRAILTMSSAGTYIVRLYAKGQLVEADMANWKWHSSRADRFVCWGDDDEFDEDEDFVQIRDLTSKVLKTLEYWYDVDDELEEIKYTFTPVGG